MNWIVDCSKTGDVPFGNRFGSLSLWHYLGTTPDERMWHEWAEAMPQGWLKTHYPWLEEMQIFVASGGSYLGYPRQPQDVDCCEFTRDLFRNPADRSVLDDYDFQPLTRACGNMLRQGVRPCLKLHAVPIKYSSRPKIDWFRVNCRPPDDYAVYADYISALVQAMVVAFGRKEVCRWRWFVGTEMENRNWWQAGDESPETTQQEYFKFHDWSVLAIERVLGDGCGPIGAHAMMAGEVSGGFWDPQDFIEHCRNGRNHATGGSGSRLDFFAISYYDRSPGFLERDEWNTNLPGAGDLSRLETFVDRTRTALDAHGFAGVPIEVGEGGMLFGMDGKWLWHGLCPGGMFDATWTAWAFWKLIENKVAGWSRWPLLRTGGLFHGPEAAATHAMRMIAELKDDRRVSIPPPDDDPRLLRVVAGLSSAGNTLRLLVFHHAPDVTKPTATAKVELTVKNFSVDGPVRVTWRTLDAQHGDFWPQWEKDRAMLRLTDNDYFRSCDQLDVVHALINPTHKAFWAHYAKGYESLAAYPEEESATCAVRDGAMSLALEVPCFSLTLYTMEGNP